MSVDGRIVVLSILVGLVVGGCVWFFWELAENLRALLVRRRAARPQSPPAEVPARRPPK